MVDHPSSKLSPEKRTNVFRVSSEEFASNGLKRASLNRIISSLGMSKSSFYHYFKNKTDLFHHTLEYILKPVLDVHQSVDLEALTAETLWPEINKMVGDMTQLVNVSPDMLIAGRMFYRCYEDPDDRQVTEEVLAEFAEWITRLIQRGQSLGVFRTDLPESLLIDLLMATGMSMDRWMLGNWEQLDDTERTRISQTGFELFVQILTPVNTQDPQP